MKTEEQIKRKIRVIELLIKKCEIKEKYFLDHNNFSKSNHYMMMGNFHRTSKSELEWVLK